MGNTNPSVQGDHKGRPLFLDKKEGGYIPAPPPFYFRRLFSTRIRRFILTYLSKTFGEGILPLKCLFFAIARRLANEIMEKLKNARENPVKKIIPAIMSKAYRPKCS